MNPRAKVKDLVQIVTIDGKENIITHSRAYSFENFEFNNIIFELTLTFFFWHSNLF